MTLSQNNQEEKERHWIKYFLNISVVIVLFALILFIGLIIRNSNLIHNEIRTRAQTYFKQIVITREWNAHYGGVYVEKTEGMVSNPYLKDPDIKTIDGKVYTLKNPALMTREISELHERNGLTTFHMTSLKPINPMNKPDAFEENALNAFENGEKEIFKKEKEGKTTSFRYMAPLFVDQDCLKCHTSQGYKVGDIRGGISVSFDITAIEKSLKFNNIVILFLAVLSSIVLLTIISIFTFNLKKTLDEAHRKINEMAITDDLTSLYNRGFFFSRLNEEIKRAKRFKQDLSCIMMDIDFFKKVNDTFGHQAGDIVLKNVSDTIKTCCREIDIVARYGGEEIVILLPGTGKDGALVLAENIRKAVERLENVYMVNTKIPVTVSLGVADLTSRDLEMIIDDEIIKRADIALFKAKEKGRNRSETYSTD